MPGTKPVAILCLSLLALGARPALSAKPKGPDGGEIMKKYDCLTCHNPTRKVVGPAFVDIAKKYKGVKKIVPTLVAKVKAGGSGNWGAVPMAPHPSIPDEDLTAMVKYVLAQK